MVQKRILVIEQQDEVFNLVKELFDDQQTYHITQCNTSMEQIKEAMKEIPDVIVINDDDHIDIYKHIVGNNTLFMIPVIAVSSKCKNIDILRSVSAGLNSYIIKPLDKNYLYYKIKNYINLIYGNRTVSSLTGLPGNIQISNELIRRTSRRQKFYVLYIDLDNFKAYNDTYGFLKGDQVIKLTGDIIVESVCEYGERGDFVGHIRWR